MSIIRGASENGSRTRKEHLCELASILVPRRIGRQCWLPLGRLTRWVLRHSVCSITTMPPAGLAVSVWLVALWRAGSGGSFSFADPDAQVGYAYAPNRQQPYILDDPLELALRNAFYRCLQNK